ncbi:MAG: hypothetical protein QM658_08950 [Gordonia sp. (in: high G+C Gram-positive bacteria)]
MTTYDVEISVVFGAAMSPGEFADVVDALSDAASEVAGGIDADVSGGFRDQTLALHFTLDDESDEQAFARATSAARTVIRASGAPATDWRQITMRHAHAAEFTAV